MNHDFIETYTGDLNRAIKDKNEDTKRAWSILERSSVPVELLAWTDKNIEERLGDDLKITLFQIADILEALMYCISERRRGNQLLRHAENEYMDKLRTHWDKVPNSTMLHDIVLNINRFPSDIMGRED